MVEKRAGARRKIRGSAAPKPAHSLRYRNDAYDRLLPRCGELLTPSERPPAGRGTTYTPRLRAAGLFGVHRRIAPDDSAGPLNAWLRPLDQGKPAELRGPHAFRSRK